VKVSYEIPINIDDKAEFQNAAAVRAITRALEDGGFDACHLTDHPAPTAKWRNAGGHDALDPFAALSFVAAMTTRLKLHTHIVVLPYRNPFVTAKAAATLDVLSEGRLILGVGGGYLRGEFAALGVDFDSRGAQMDDGIRTMKAVWAGETVVAETSTFTAVGNMARPLPVQQPHPPIWVGGNSDRAMRRAIELGDGWSPFITTPLMSKTTRTDDISDLAELKAKIDKLREGLAKSGRARPFDITTPLAGGEAIARGASVQALVDEAGALAEMGVTWITAEGRYGSRAEHLADVEWFAANVLPQIHAL
jgi:probable F420-dependent oxidoreductase